MAINWCHSICTNLHLHCSINQLKSELLWSRLHPHSCPCSTVTHSSLAEERQSDLPPAADLLKTSTPKVFDGGSLIHSFVQTLGQLRVASGRGNMSLAGAACLSVSSSHHWIAPLACVTETYQLTGLNCVGFREKNLVSHKNGAVFTGKRFQNNIQFADKTLRFWQLETLTEQGRQMKVQ